MEWHESSEPTGSGMWTCNVHDVLEESRRMLDIGELLASSTFELHNALTAREIGDPRMDPVVPRCDQRTLSEREKGGEAPLDLDQECLLTIFDKIVQLEIGWHDQYLLSQTVYTCLYMMDLERTRENPVLYAYCQSVHVICSYLFHIIYAARVCSDEDVSVATPGLEIDEINDSDLINSLACLDDAIVKISSTGSTAKEILCRLKFRKMLVTLLHDIHNANTREDLVKVSRICREIMSIIDELNAVDDAVVANVVGCAPTLHNVDIGPVPVKALKVRSVKQAWSAWAEMIESLMKSCDWISKVQGWKDLKNGLDMFAGQDNHGFVRSIIYRLIVHPTANPDIWVPWSPTIGMIVREILLIDPNIAFFKSLGKVPDLEMFLNQCVIAVQGCCHVKCLNRVRQQRRLKHNVSDWKNMIGHAYNAETSSDVHSWLEGHGFAWNTSIDSHIVPRSRLAPLTCWVVREATWTCMQHILLGAPLELYEPEEISSVYWYASYLLDHGEHMAKEYDAISMTKKIGKAQISRLLHDATLDTCSTPPTSEPLKESWLRRKMATFFGFALGSISRTSMALRAYNLFPKMKHVFNGREEQFMQRFEFMQELSIPEFLDYSSYLEYENHLAHRSLAESDGSMTPDLVFSEECACIMLQESLDYSDTCLDIFLTLEPFIPEPIFTCVKRTLSANKTALHVLVGLTRKSGKRLSAEFSASWTFSSISDTLVPWEFSTVVVALPTLTLQRIPTTMTLSK